jgi:hypothetical protein
MENEIDLSMPAIPLATAVPMPMPMAPPTVLQTPLTPHGTNNDSPQLRKDQIETLRQQGFPLGLAHELGKTRAAYPLRFWVVDNSGRFPLQIRVPQEACRIDRPLSPTLFRIFVWMLVSLPANSLIHRLDANERRSPTPLFRFGRHHSGRALYPLD